MPKRLKDKRLKRLKPAKRAKGEKLVLTDTVEAELTSDSFEAMYRAKMSMLGRRGGKIGGKRRMETMTPEQRSEISLRAAKARWGKRKTG